MTSIKFFYDKKEDKEVSYKLNINEFKCKCNYNTCHYTLVSSALLVAWEKARKAYDSPLHITSGFRCQLHNVDVRGKMNSRHTIGNAVDISFNGQDRVRLLKILEKHFKFVLQYDTFVHCDVRDS